MTRRRDLDEDDVRVRPGKGSRPRTRTRPEHADAVDGMVTAVDRGRYTCLIDGRPVVAVRARELGRSGRVVVGDRVGVEGELDGGRDSLARIVRVDPRTSVLRRSADDTDPVERVLVANADQLVIVTAVANPEPRPRLIDRCIVAAFDAGLLPLLCLTKTDLASPAALLETYAPLKVGYLTWTKGADVADVHARLTGHTSVLVGHSGVGKSTLVNALVPDAMRSTGVVNAVTGRGRHTSSSAVALPLAGGGWVVDTPGVRSFGLAHVSPQSLLVAFPDLLELVEACPPGCDHTGTDPHCALDGGAADPARLVSYRRLLGARGNRDSELE
ncbi:MAG: ribosome biosis GTPase / thiamine phosphate phosphatase [Frankiales bacterium]|nr:ribosome biosis GTPase / thiamine phosphate phosphatase [Frankiales bacterium]